MLQFSSCNSFTGWKQLQSQYATQNKSTSNFVQFQCPSDFDPRSTALWSTALCPLCHWCNICTTSYLNQLFLITCTFQSGQSAETKQKAAEEGGNRRGMIQLEPSGTNGLCLGITRHSCDKTHAVFVRQPSAAESCKKMGRWRRKGDVSRSATLVRDDVSYDPSMVTALQHGT